MKLKLDSNGNVVLQDGRPVYERDGREIAFDGAEAFAKIGQLTGENTEYKKRFTDAETKLKAYEGIEDPSAAIKALETLKNIDEGKLIAAGKVEEIKAAAQKAAQDQVAAASKAHAEELARTKTDLEKRTSELNAHMIGGGFASSRLLSDDKHPMRLAIPAEMARAYFGNNFKIEDGKVIGYDVAGNKIYSSTRPGEIATFDEALEAMVQQCPFKDQIVRATRASGSGAPQGSGGGSGGKKTMTRAAFEALDPNARAAAVQDTVITD